MFKYISDEDSSTSKTSSRKPDAAPVGSGQQRQSGSRNAEAISSQTLSTSDTAAVRKCIPQPVPSAPSKNQQNITISKPSVPLQPKPVDLAAASTDQPKPTTVIKVLSGKPPLELPPKTPTSSSSQSQSIRPVVSGESVISSKQNGNGAKTLSVEGQRSCSISGSELEQNRMPEMQAVAADTSRNLMATLAERDQISKLLKSKKVLYTSWFFLSKCTVALAALAVTD